jgi:hypothetical protein
MGSTSWSSSAYDSFKSSYKSKSTDDIFTHNKTKDISSEMDPKGLKFREARDSDTHPQTVAIGIFLDETGSMGAIPEMIVREKLRNLMETLITHGIKDAAVLFGGIGDHIGPDQYPLQVGQFESGTEELNKWLTDIYLEGMGGGQNRESYLLAWLIAGRHTSIDCFEKRGQKGFLFTIGDEASWNKIKASRLQQLLGYSQAEDVTDVQLLAEAQRMYHVFHIHIQEGSYKNDPQILKYWKDLLKERLIVLEDYTKISEVIASTVAVISGADMEKVLDSFDSKTSLVVRNSIVNAIKVENGAVEGIINL